ncbi:MAG TPA: flagellar biosynthetic protein FliO [Syntrophomonas sp.]|nr:flagellar biosynthetic protein FliO [Syntrophomonas sp.]
MCKPVASLRKRCIAILLLTLLLVLILAFNVLAVQDFGDVQKALESEQVENTRAPNLFLNFVKLIFILALIVGAAWSIIRLFGNKVSSRLQGTWIQVVDEVMLGQNRGIVLCEVGEKIYAIGVTDHNITVLFEIDNPKLLEEISKSNITIVETEATFNWNLWRKTLSKFLKPHRSRSSVPDSFHRLIEQQSQRLDEISYRSTQNTEVDSRRSDEHE